MIYLKLREWIEQFLPANHESAEVLYDLDLGILIPGHGITHVGIPHATKASFDEDETFDMLVIKGEYVPHAKRPYVALTLADTEKDYECYKHYCQEMRELAKNKSREESK